MRVVESGSQNSERIILVPGWGCGAWVFHETLSPLASAGFHAIAVELKGHGLSDKPADEGEYSAEAMRDHLAAILDALGGNSYGIVGHSMGAAIAADLASVSPERVNALVLAAPVGFAGVKLMWLFRLLTPQFALPIIQRLATRTLIRMMLSVVYGSAKGATERDVDEFYAPTRLPGFVRALRHLLHRFDWNQSYPGIPVRTMAVAGSEDVLSPARDVGRYSADAVVIEKAGHVLFSEAPEIVNRELIRFFGQAPQVYISSTDEQIKT